ATLITVITLSMFRWIESKIPSMKYAQLSVRFLRSNQYADEDSLRALLKEHDIKSFEAAYQLYDQGSSFQYQMTMRTTDMKNFRRLAQSLMDMEDVHEFRITPSS
ncbi:MAG: MgtC/SapB family protein, partial [Gammaproteobacteria bacterium]|nr:MgtC/SapB family protein [Gammaproteobacteria bacterium]